MDGNAYAKAIFTYYFDFSQAPRSGPCLPTTPWPGRAAPFRGTPCPAPPRLKLPFFHTAVLSKTSGVNALIIYSIYRITRLPIYIFRVLFAVLLAVSSAPEHILRPFSPPCQTLVARRRDIRGLRYSSRLSSGNLSLSSRSKKALLHPGRNRLPPLRLGIHPGIRRRQEAALQSGQTPYKMRLLRLRRG
jgi:hypothetical protein